MTPSASGPHLVGVIGLGIMGSSIARNLVDAGFRVTGFDLDATRCADAARDGATIAASTADAAAAT